MTNYEAIVKMTPEQMEQFLDDVYVAGLNDGMFAARTGNNGVLDQNPFDACWLAEKAETAITSGLNESGDTELLESLGDAILRQAGIVLKKEAR